MSDGSRNAATEFWSVLLMILVALSAVGACRSNDAEKAKLPTGASSADLQRSAASLKQALAKLEKPIADVSAKYEALRPQFDALPADLPDFGETRGEFYAATISLGTMTAKIPWLSDKIDAAVRAGDRPSLDAISKDIARTHDQIREADRIASTLVHKVVPFRKLAAELAASNAESCENPTRPSR